MFCKRLRRLIELYETIEQFASLSTATMEVCPVKIAMIVITDISESRTYYQEIQ